MQCPTMEVWLAPTKARVTMSLELRGCFKNPFIARLMKQYDWDRLTATAVF